MRIFFFGYLVFILAQRTDCQTFFPEPEKHVEFEVQLDLANECYIHFENPGGDSLRLRWKKLEVSMPQGWNIDLCDYGLCYGGIPASGLMNWIYDTTQAYLKLIVQPGNNPGAAWVAFRVHENGNTGNYQDVFYSLHTPGVLGQTDAPSPYFNFGPNPANEFCNFYNRTTEMLPMILFDLRGRLLLNQEIAAGAEYSISTESYAPGVYYLQVGQQLHKLIVHH